MVAAAQPSTLVRRACLHCGLSVDGGRDDDFCCSGCEAVYGLLHVEHLDDYYRLQGTRGVPLTDRHAERRDASPSR